MLNEQRKRKIILEVDSDNVNQQQMREKKKN